jgi:ADP-ribose pyrophosphatase
VVVFVCHGGQGNYLLSRRSQNTRDENGKWEFNEGQLKWGEKVEVGLRRELKEELNLTAKRLEFTGYRDVHRVQNGRRDHWISLDYLVQVNPRNVRLNEREKFDEIGWFRLNKLPRPLHSQALKTVKEIKMHLRNRKWGI